MKEGTLFWRSGGLVLVWLMILTLHKVNIWTCDNMWNINRWKVPILIDHKLIVSISPIYLIEYVYLANLLSDVYVSCATLIQWNSCIKLICKRNTQQKCASTNFIWFIVILWSNNNLYFILFSLWVLSVDKCSDISWWVKWVTHLNWNPALKLSLLM